MTEATIAAKRVWEIVDGSYPDGLTQISRDEPGACGDGLADFIVADLSDLLEHPTVPRCHLLEIALRLENAADDLLGVANAIRDVLESG